MTPLFKKLNFKDHGTIFVLNAPESFNAELSAMKSHAAIRHGLPGTATIRFAICFATTQSELETAASDIVPKLDGDAVLWFCYPKASSRRYTCNFNRDTGFWFLGGYGLEGVRSVAIDEDWTALRFRRVGYIKKMVRRESFAMSEAGRAKASGMKPESGKHGAD